MIEWLNDNSGAVQAGVGLVLALTLLVILWYAWEARKMAKVARESALCPVIEQYLDSGSLWSDADKGYYLDLDIALSGVAEELHFRVNYGNTGSGPAVNICWFLYAAGRHLIDTRKRVGMGVGAQEGFVAFAVDRRLPEGGFLVKAEYESVFGILWRSTLPLVLLNGSSLQNGEPKVERISRRTEM